MVLTARKASSANDGFFQTVPCIENQFHDDPSFSRTIKLFLPQDVVEELTPDLSNFGEKVISRMIFNWVTDAERNLPYIKGSGRDAFGHRTSELVVAEGWRELQKFGIEQRIVSAGYEPKYGQYTRIAQFLKTQLWTGSCASVTCPSAMTDGAAKLLKSHLLTNDLDTISREVFQDAYNRLISKESDYAWTSGQWMTERSGGSDVSGTETIATYSPVPTGHSTSGQPLGPWNIDGFKWFSSATDSSMTILLAQTSNGLSAFFAPMYRQVNGSSSDKELNGIQIQRLKNKFGTKSLPTAELELRGTRGYLIGKEGHGIQEVSTILNITRLYSAVSTLGYVGRGLAIAKAFAKVREIGAGKGKRIRLYNSSLHMNTLAKLMGEYHVMMLFAFFVAWMIGIDEHNSKGSLGVSKAEHLRPDAADVPLLLRVLTPVLKGSVCKRSSQVLLECMEALGGVGYLDNCENEAINISRLYRDCIVNSIWEGTTDVLATDALRVLKGRSCDQVLHALDRWISKAAICREVSQPELAKGRDELLLTWRALKENIKSQDVEDLLPSAREVLFQLADVVMGVLLFADTQIDESALTKHIFLRVLKDKSIGENKDTINKASWEGGLRLNQEIVFGEAATSLSTPLPKL